MIGGPTSGAHVPVKPPNLISLQPMSWQTSDTQLFMQLPDDLLIVLVLETVQERDRVLGGQGAYRLQEVPLPTVDALHERSPHMTQ